MKTTIYRIHYGFEWIYKSIDSIKEWSDEIIICVSKQPWYDKQEVMYLGKMHPVIHPENIEENIEILKNIPKVSVIIREFETPRNQWATLVNEYSTDWVLTMEPDMIFPFDPSELEKENQHLYCEQIEYWKNENWRIPHRRNRVGPVLYRKPSNMNTALNNLPLNAKCIKSSLITENYGFCFSEQLMLYKHLLSIGFSKKIGDSIPNEKWYEDKWLNWDESKENLEISLGRESNIKKAIPC
jgi:hypothetical protein